MLIAVTGAGRSGTTMLDLMLGTRPDAFSCGEAFGWFRPWESEKLEVTTEHLRLRCSCGQMPCPVWSELRHVDSERFHRTVADSQGVTHVIDSSKELRWVVDATRWAAEAGLATASVLIYKHPLELSYSWWKRGWLGEPDEHGQIDSRIGLKSVQEFIDYHTELFATDLEPVAVSYTALVNDPASVLRRVCDRLGIGYVDGQERFWTKQHHFVFGSGTVRRGLQKGAGEVYAGAPSARFRAQTQRFSQELAANEHVQKILSRLEAMTVEDG